eukprot:SAG31_NODE_21_length_34109_cov_60.598824_30_plen_139_part_00
MCKFDENDRQRDSSDIELPIHAAAASGDVDTLKRIIRESARIADDPANTETAATLICNALDADGRSPLWLATYSGHLEIVEQLLQAGASPNVCAADVVDPFTKTTVWRQCSALWTSVHCGAPLMHLNHSQSLPITPNL